MDMKNGNIIIAIAKARSRFKNPSHLVAGAAFFSAVSLPGSAGKTPLSVSGLQARHGSDE